EIDDNDIPLINALKELRMELAIKNNMKAFEICDDVTLIKIAQDKPTTISELESVNYLDFEFVEKYGTVVIKCLSNNVVIT
ncbi:MAG: HRDC domain-containing protein, partial [Eubacterium sp.]|nr:HRDC domain-containing protein [Eubacterium sp.]